MRVFLKAIHEFVETTGIQEDLDEISSINVSKHNGKRTYKPLMLVQLSKIASSKEIHKTMIFEMKIRIEPQRTKTTIL